MTLMTMTNAALLLYPVLLLVLTFFGARIIRRGSGNESPDNISDKGCLVSSSFLAPDQTKMIQAAACIGIILHHVTQQITFYGAFWKGPVTVFSYLGILFTSVFFFCSGFGLITSLYTKPDYLKSFLYRRLPTVLIPFWVINALGVLLNASTGIHYDVSKVLRCISGISLINSNGWFIVEIVFFYLFFYILFRLIRNRDIALVLLCAAVIAVIIFSFYQGHDPQGAQVHWFRGEWWYNSTVTFIFGLLAARFREKMTGFLRRHYAVLLTLFSVLTVVTLSAAIYFVNFYGYYQDAYHGNARRCAAYTLCVQSIACIVFVTFLLLLQMRITIGNRALRYMSTLSRELFLIHGYFVNKIFGSVGMNDFLRYAVILTCSIACTAIVSPCVRWIVRQVIRFLSCLAAKFSRGRAVISPSSSTETDLLSFADASSQKDSPPGRVKKAGLLSRRSATILIAVPAVLLLVTLLRRDILSRAEYATECESIRQAAVGDEVFWGHYNTDSGKYGKERLAWIVAEKDEDQVLLVTRDGIDGCYYHRKHESVSWEDSDLRALLNSDAFTGAFSRYEKKNLIPIDGDLVTLLTAEQARTFFPTDRDRVLSVTKEARHRGANADPVTHDQSWFEKGYCFSWWWLRGEPGQKSITAPIVNNNGSISLTKKAVNKPSGAVRPVVRVSV